MDKQSFTVYASSLLSTLRVESAPSGVCYTAFMSQGLTLADYIALVDILKMQGLITEKGHVLSLTEKGITLARQIDDAIANR